MSARRLAAALQMARNACLRGRFGIVLAIALFAAAFPASGRGELQRPRVIDQAEFVPGEDLQPPPDSAEWKPVSLPDNWYLSHPGLRGTIWYRLRFSLESVPFLTHTFVLPRNTATHIGLFVNRKRVGGTGFYGDSGVRGWTLPVAMGVPPIMLRAGENTMHIRLNGVADFRHGLPRVTMDEGPLAGPVFAKRRDLQYTLFVAVGAVALLAGCLALAFWWRDRREAVMGWFAASAFSWALMSYPGLWRPLLNETPSRGVAAFLITFLYAAPLLMLCLRAANRRWPWMERAIWLFTAAGALFAAFGGEVRAVEIITWWGGIYLVALLGLLGGLVGSEASRSVSYWVLVAALAVLVLFNAHDLGQWMGWVDYDDVTLAHFAIPLVLFAIGATVVERHFRAVAAVERAKHELEDRVVEKTREIEANYARVQEAEREKAMARERARIMADMHDGVGSSLIGLVGAVRSGQAGRQEIERRLQEALQELRLAVDSLEPVDGDLGVVLGIVRHRMREPIEASGVRFVWQVGDMPRVGALTPKTILAIQRVVLEAIANALRHSRAKTITVSTQVDPAAGRLLIRVADDGVGFDAGTVQRGRGLDNLSNRARSFGGSVEIESGAGRGTQVSLLFPLPDGRA